jgi:integrase
VSKRTAVLAVALALVIGGAIGFAWHAPGRSSTWADIRTWVGFAVVIIGVVIALVQLDLQRRQLAGQHKVIQEEVERNKNRGALPAHCPFRANLVPLPDGALMPGNGGRRYQRYGTVYSQFTSAARAAEIPAGFTPHSLRHAFASAMLNKGVSITDVAHWLGHRDVRVTFRIYGHLVPSAAARGCGA